MKLATECGANAPVVFAQRVAAPGCQESRKAESQAVKSGECAFQILIVRICRTEASTEMLPSLV